MRLGMDHVLCLCDLAIQPNVLQHAAWLICSAAPRTQYQRSLWTDGWLSRVNLIFKPATSSSCRGVEKCRGAVAGRQSPISLRLTQVW